MEGQTAWAMVAATVSQLRAELDETRNELAQKLTAELGETKERLTRAETELSTVRAWQLVGINAQFMNF